MKIKTIEASLFKPLPSELKQSLMASGVLPVNDVYLPLIGNKNKITLLYGSYGSGKSVFIVDLQLDKSINNLYHRCYFGRKIFDTIRGTVFKTIVDRIEERSLSHLFNYSKAPNGSMIITNRENGNEFVPFGGNDPASLKSIKDPTDFFCEELDQFTFEDFGFIYSRLRTEKAETQFYGAFNTEKIFQSHWLRKIFFDGEFSDQAFKLKANYKDNIFIDHEDYYSKLRLIANGNETVLNAIAGGEWGVVRTGGEFWKQFNESKHVIKTQYVPGLVYACLDENVIPYVTNTIWQVRGMTINQIHEICSESPNNNAPKAAELFCEWLASVNHKDVVWVCGDPSASKRSTVDANSASFYTKFIEILHKNGYKVENKVMKSAPEVALSGAFVNAIYENNLYGWHIGISDHCFKSIEDYIMVKEGPDGKMVKEEVTDPITKKRYQIRGHISDTKRYMVLTTLAKEFQEYKGRTKSKTWRGGMP